MVKSLLKPTHLIFLLALLGLGVSSFLAYEYNLTGPVTCPIGGSGCEIVRSSSYSNIFGISVPYLGILFYLVLAVLTILLMDQKTKLLAKLLFTWSLLGVASSAYFTFLEAFVIHAYCFWCLSSAIIASLIFMLILFSPKPKYEI